MINGGQARFSHPGAILANPLLTLNRGALSWLPRPVLVVNKEDQRMVLDPMLVFVS